jgi:CDP-diacylglycerol--serine O-phosphatidyltransferase
MAPGLIMFSFLQTYCETPCAYIPYVAFLIPVFSALRLAKFNIDERQTSSFIGLPTPANAVFLASSAALFDIEGYNVEALKPFMQNVYVVIAVILVMCYLLVCELPMFSLKFKSLKWADNKSQFILIGSSVILFAVFKLAAISMIILLFIFMSVILFFMKKGK